MPTVTTMSLTAGATFARFRIVEPLGKGGMAVVYKAYELHLERHVALKVLPAALLHEEAFSQRFEREARIVAQLEHPHIVPIYNFGIDEGVPWMSMRLLSGGTLSEHLQGKRFTPPEVVRVLETVAAALDHAHAHGVVHRDVKPSNIMRDAFGHHYLTDFGIARMSAAATQLTVTGMMTGTPFYMSPEQALGGTVDGRSDIYSLGIVAYEMLAGAVPFTGDTPMAVMMKHTHDPLPAPDPAVLPASVFHTLLTCLAKKPSGRYATATSFVQALQTAGAAGAGAVASAGRVDDTAPTRLVRAPLGGRPDVQQVEQASSGSQTPRRRWTVAISITISLCALLAVGLTTIRRSAVPPAVVAQNEPINTAPQPQPSKPAPRRLPPPTSSAARRGSDSAPSAAPAAAVPAAAAPSPVAPPQPSAPPEPVVTPPPSTPPSTPPAATASSPGLTFRHDGSYRVGPIASGRYVHWIFRADGTCSVVNLRLSALFERAAADARGPSCAYQMTRRGAAISITRSDGTTEHAIAFRAPDESLTIRRQPTEFVPFVTR